MAGCAVGEDARVAPGALVTAWTLHTLHTHTLASGLVTLRCLDAPGVAVTGSALHAGVPPEELLALAAGAASEARHAVALPCELITGRPEGMSSIAAAGVAPRPTGQLPGVGRTAVTVLADHVREAEALPGGFVALAIRTITVLLHRAQVIADTLAAVLAERVAIVSKAAELAALPLRVVQALEAPPGLLVAGFRVRCVDVAVTLARLTCPPHI